MAGQMQLFAIRAYLNSSSHITTSEFRKKKLIKMNKYQLVKRVFIIENTNSKLDLAKYRANETMNYAQASVFKIFLS